MPKRKADDHSPPSDRGSPPDGQPDEEPSDRRMAVQRQGEVQTADAAAAAQPSAAAEPDAIANRSATASTVSPFSRLATVELQLIMRCCDQSTLIALARCNKFALAAASHPFVWQSLSPINLQCDWPLLLSKSLLRHADISVTWRLRSKTAMSADQVTALAALPLLRGLSVKNEWPSSPSEEDYFDPNEDGAVWLFQALRERIGHSGALTSLTLKSFGLRQASSAALAAFIERSRTLTTLKITDIYSKLRADGPITTLVAALIRCRTLTDLCLEVASDEPQPAAWRALAAVVQQSPSLTTFRLYGLARDAEHDASFTTAVAQSRSLTNLQLPYCFNGAADVEALAAVVEQNSRIRRLDVSGNGIRRAGAASLARLLASDRCSLTSLDVSDNWIETEGALALARGLQTNRSLTELRLGRNRIASRGTTAVVSALQHNPHCRLRVLDLSSCSIDHQAAAALAAAMQRSGALERLEVNCCWLTDEAMATLAAGIGHNPSLQHLDVSLNKLGAAGAAALAAAVSTCPALTSLDVGVNWIGDAGLAALAPAMVSMRTLKLNDCKLTSQSGELLAWLGEHSLALESLGLDNNSLSASGVAVLVSSLQPSSSLRTLHAERCDAGADDVIALADALCRGWRASELQLGRDRSIGDSAALALAAAMERLGSRCTLTSLSLRDCGLTAAGALALVRAATVTPRLQSLNLHWNDEIAAADMAALIAACGPQPHFELRLRA